MTNNVKYVIIPRLSCDFSNVKVVTTLQINVKLSSFMRYVGL